MGKIEDIHESVQIHPWVRSKTSMSQIEHMGEIEDIHELVRRHPWVPSPPSRLYVECTYETIFRQKWTQWKQWRNKQELSQALFANPAETPSPKAHEDGQPTSNTLEDGQPKSNTPSPQVEIEPKRPIENVDSVSDSLNSKKQKIETEPGLKDEQDPSGKKTPRGDGGTDDEKIPSSFVQSKKLISDFGKFKQRGEELLEEIEKEDVWKWARNEENRGKLLAKLNDIKQKMTSPYRLFILDPVNLKNKMKNNPRAWEALNTSFQNDLQAEVQTLANIVEKLMRKHAIEMEYAENEAEQNPNEAEQKA